MHHFYVLLQVLKVLLINIYKTQLPDLKFLMFYISFFTSADINFHNSALSEKRFSTQNFLL